MNKVPVVFFDIGDTLGSPKFFPLPYHLESVNIYPYIPGILQQLKSAHLRLGIISNTGNETEASMKKVLFTGTILNSYPI